MATKKGTSFLDQAGLIQLVKSLDDRYMGHPFILVGASSEVDGRAGAAPKPLAGDEEKILFGDGTWKNASINVNDIHQLVWHSITLTSAKYRIVDLFPETYGTLTTITNTLEPDETLLVFDDMYNMNATTNLLQDLPVIDTSRATSMEAMYKNCTNLANIPRMTTTNVTNMKEIFYSCTSLLNIPPMTTTRVTDMSYAFYGCTAIWAIPELDTSSVTDMTSMFEGCTNLKTLSWQIDCSAITEASKLTNMFKGTELTAANLTNISNLIQSEVTDALLKGE